MIQGNFYERLHFYMDSCAISPTASLFRKVDLSKQNLTRTADENNHLNAATSGLTIDILYVVDVYY